MSIVSIVYMPEGIAMAADSRLTVRHTISKDEKTTEELVTLSDNSQKLFLLSKCSVGIASVGNAFINGQTISDYIRLFEINDITDEDTPETVANKLFAHKDEYIGTTFLVCGYDRDVPYVFVIDKKEKKRENVDTDNNIGYGLKWEGENEALTKLITLESRMKIDANSTPLKDSIDLAEFMVDLTIKYQRFSDGIQTCGGPIDILVLTKDTAFWYRHKLYK